MFRKKELSLLAAVILGMAPFSSVSAEVAYRINGDSDYARVITYSQEGRVYVVLDQVKSNRNDVNGVDVTTHLYYSVVKYGDSYSYWSGQIDNSDVIGDGNGNLTLNTDTCAYVSNASCGPLNITWSKNGDYVSRTTGVTRTETLNTIYQETGTSTSYRSDVEGAALGVAVTGYSIYANQGSRHSSNLTISVK